MNPDISNNSTLIRKGTRATPNKRVTTGLAMGTFSFCDFFW